MEDTLTIRFASLADIDTIRQLAQEIWPATYKDILSPDQIRYMMDLLYSEQALHDQVAGKQYTFLIVSLDKAPIGFASYSPVGLPGIYKLHKIYIHPGIHGKGIGKTVIDFVIVQVKSKNGTALQLNVNRYNKAKQFYERLGFAVIKEEDIDIGNNYFMNDYVMEKQF